MSSHYIDLVCPAPGCTRSEGIYTGSVLTDYFEAALDYEGATIDARCDEHSSWEAPAVEDEARTLPDPKGGCACSFDSEDRGGGHSELVQEYEPACPVHSEHLYDPKLGMWVHREGGEAIQELPMRMFVLEPEGQEVFIPQRKTDCPCAACDPGLIIDGKPTGLPSRMSVCPDCGNKRCPKAANHARWQCSGSNAVGQVGVPVEHEHRWVARTTYDDRGLPVQACTVVGCPALLLETRP